MTRELLKDAGRPEIVCEASPTPEVRLLIEELEAELASLYLPEQRHGLALNAIFQPHVRFFVARFDGRPAGCGGIALFPEFAEVKRMYVRKTLRGRGLADAILERLEQEALADGLKTLRLETGIHQHPALKFYRRVGFLPCAIFPPYSAMEPVAVATSVFLEIRLA